MKKYLLDLLFVALLQILDLAGAFLGLFDLLPSLHLFLFKKSDAVGQQLRVPLDPINSHQHSLFKMGMGNKEWKQDILFSALLHLGEAVVGAAAARLACGFL